MKDVNETLTHIENLLILAEDRLRTDDGRRWPPTPAPPKDRRDWATDNSSAVDPHDYDSCKDYVLTKLPMRPLFRPGMFRFSRFPMRIADLFALRVRFRPGEWVNTFYSGRPFERRALVECRELYGMEVEAKAGKLGKIKWSGKFTRQPDTRRMTHAQRLAELSLFRCRNPILNVYEILKAKADRLSLIDRLVWGARVGTQFESTIACHYMQEVVKPLWRLGWCVLRSNRLSKALYKSPKRRFPIAGYGLALDNRRITVPYPWWSGTRIDWRLLCDVASGGPNEDAQAMEEGARWKHFEAAWETTEQKSLSDILALSLFHFVRQYRPKAAFISLELMEVFVEGL